MWNNNRKMLRRARNYFFTAVLFGFLYVLLNIYTSTSGIIHYHISTVECRSIRLDSNPPSSVPLNNTRPPTTVLNITSQQNLSHSKPSNNQRPVQLIIITRWRSGSSFTGELFNNNPDFAYFFEPLIGLTGSQSGVQMGQRHVELLHRILACNMTGTNHTWWSGQWNINCGKSMTFGKTILCEYFRNVVDRGAATNRTNVMVQDVCRSQRHVALKTVRVPDIAYLKSIVSDPRLNVKVINLVRDPRAVFLSRGKTQGVDSMHHDECDEMENNLRFWKDPPSWLKGRHMLLRYEDLAENPLFITHQIYEFLQLPVPLAVKLYLEYNTNWNEVGQFSHARVSGEAAHKWRHTMDYRAMLAIQRHCIVPMIMAGYLPITSKNDLRNMSVPTLNRYSYPLLPNITQMEDVDPWKNDSENSEDSFVAVTEGDDTRDDDNNLNDKYSSSSYDHVK